nr:efflux RND transporter periplasmic adaptor subunit [Endozoicomonas sp. OPT23]
MYDINKNTNSGPFTMRFTTPFKLLQQVDINRSWLLAGLLSMVLAVFLLTADYIQPKESEQAIAENPDNRPVTDNKLASVVVQNLNPETMHRVITLYGETQPDRTITVTAEMAARVTAVSGKRGQLVKRGDDIAALYQGSLPQQVKAAEARVSQTSIDYQSALSLKDSNHIARNRLAQLEVDKSQADSELARLKVMLANTQLRAPVSGVLNERFTEQGDFVDKGKPVATILDLDPLIVSVSLPQGDVGKLTTGDSAKILYLDGQQVTGKIRYISSQSDQGTKTYQVEIAINNPGMAKPAGMSVEAELMLETVTAIKISPALISLSEVGEPGIKWIDSSRHVGFSPIDIVRTEADGLWVTGIPDQARLITRGQGFVREGDLVTVSVDAIPELVSGTVQ